MRSARSFEPADPGEAALDVDVVDRARPRPFRRRLSAREDATRFWSSASGVGEAKLETPGRDILLVSGYDAGNGRIVLSVPPGIEPRRVSVDAIEHWHLPGASRRRRDPPCPRVARRDPGHRGQLPVRDGGAGRRRRAAPRRRARSRPRRSSVEEILDRVAPRLLALVPMT